MLIKCPECDLQVSDKALTCPHCGFPVDKGAVQLRRPSGSSKKRMRLPNGFGSITQVKKNLRNPYYVRVCVGKDEFGHYILRSLKPQCSFANYNDAYAALVEYNRNPYDLDASISVKELYKKWTDEYFKDISATSVRTIESAWAYCSTIYDMRACDIRVRHLKGCMEEGFRIEYRGKKKGEKILATASTKSRIKSLFNLMFDYAVEFEVASHNYARDFDLSADIIKEKEEAKVDHINFTEKEMDTLWKHAYDVKFTDWVLIQCYMGWRPQELAKLRLDEIDLTRWYMQAGMKTPAGKQRIVPIHTCIRDLIKKNYDYALSINSEFLFNDTGQTHSGSIKITYDKYRHRFDKVIKALSLNPEHRPHDPRMTFSTSAKKAGVDEYALKEMMGHKIKDITESVYTVRDLEWLRSDLEKIKVERTN